MVRVISDTSPLLYLYRIQCLTWLTALFSQVWTPSVVVQELQVGQQQGYDVPNPPDYPWIQIIEPQSIPSSLMTLELGVGELAVLALAIEYPDSVVLLDDGLARRTAQAAGLTVWGTLRVLLEAKTQGLTESIAPLIDQLSASGMWISEDIRRRVLNLAGE